MIDIQFLIHYFYSKSNHGAMEFTIRINPRTKKAKSLIALIMEMAKGDKYISIEKRPNDTSIKAINDALSGDVIKAKNKTDLFKQLNS